jgi:hypothetical protein
MLNLTKVLFIIYSTFTGQENFSHNNLITPAETLTTVESFYLRNNSLFKMFPHLALKSIPIRPASASQCSSMLNPSHISNR